MTERGEGELRVILGDIFDIGTASCWVLNLLSAPVIYTAHPCAQDSLLHQPITLFTVFLSTHEIRTQNI